MQAVILAAGASSRFQPYSGFPHKSYFSIAGKKLIEHTLLDLEKAGIEEVVIVLKDEKDKFSTDGLRLNVKFVFQKEALGMGDALLSAKDYLDKEFFLLNAYHFDFSDFYQDMKDKKKEENEIVLLLKKDLENFSRYGAPIIKEDRILEIIEKPNEAKSEFKVIGIYFLNSKFINLLEKMPNEHYVFEKTISEYAKENKVDYLETSKDTLSLKYPWDLFKFTRLLLDRGEKHISSKASVSDTAVVEGNVVIEEGAKILDRATIKGPCYIGKNVVIGDNALVREYCDIEEGCVIGAFSEVKNSIIQEGTKMHSGFLGDSIVGRGSRLAAYFSIANRRLDRGSIKVNDIDSGLTSLGGIIGDNVSFGVRTSIMPGVVIGNNCVIGPGTVVSKNISDDTKYFVKATEIVEKGINE